MRSFWTGRAGAHPGEIAEPPPAAQHLGMAWALGWTELLSWGILFYAFSALLVPMHTDLGWSSGVLTGAYSLAILVSGLLAPAIGRHIDMHGGRWLMTAGSIFGSLMVLAWSRVDSVFAFYLIWIGMGIAMACTLYDPAFATIAPIYQRNRGTAMLIITVLGGLASTIFLPLTGWLTDRNGWRDTLVILAAVLAISTILPHALLLRTAGTARIRRNHPRLLRSFRDLMRSPWFRRFACAFFLQSFTSMAVAVHMIAYLIDHGVNPTSAAITTGIIGAAQTGARVAVTIFERVASIETLAAIMFALQMLAVAVLVLWPTGIAMVIAAILLGFGRGALTLIRPSLLLQRYPVEEFGAVNGSLAAILTLATSTAPVITGVAVGWLNGYTAVFAAYAVLSLVSAAVLISARTVPTPAPANGA